MRRFFFFAGDGPMVVLICSHMRFESMLRATKSQLATSKVGELGTIGDVEKWANSLVNGGL